MSLNSPTASIPGPAATVSTPGQGALLVLVSGLVTTGLALLGVWWLDNNTTDFHVMGWYGNYVIPAGALLVGLVAGSGYGVASYLTGFRIRRSALWAVLALQLAGYAGAQYLEFRSLTRDEVLVGPDGETLTFALNYHLQAINFAWDDHGHRGEPLGGWGYFFLGLGVVGFALGGVLAPALLIKMPYCERCALYMKRRTLALVPASIPRKRISKKDAAARAEFEQKQNEAVSNANALIKRLGDLSKRGDALGVKSALAGYAAAGAEARAVGRLPSRLRVGLVRCRQCAAGHLQPTMITGQGRSIRMQALDRLPLPADATRILAGS